VDGMRQGIAFNVQSLMFKVRDALNR